MSRQKLTIIVTCTDRKSATPADELMVRNLPTGQVSARARVWRERLARATVRRPLIDLYSGETWSQVRATCSSRPRALGFEPDVFVASAGLGLRHVSDPGSRLRRDLQHGSRRLGRRVPLASRETWWSALPTCRASPPGGRAIWVLSEAYSRVVSQQLLEDTRPERRPGVRRVKGRSATACASPRTDHCGVRSGARSPASTFAPRSQWLSLSDGERSIHECRAGHVARLVAREAASRGLRPQAHVRLGGARRSSESSACVNPRSPRRARSRFFARPAWHVSNDDSRLSFNRRWLDDGSDSGWNAGHSRFFRATTLRSTCSRLAAEEVDLVADVARIGRDEAGKLIGYQRPEKQKHVKQIQEYLDSEDPSVPERPDPRAAARGQVQVESWPDDERWTRCRRDAGDPDAPRRRWPAAGLDRRRPAAKPRALAHQEPPASSPVAGFVAPTLELQREQFLRVNTVQPLPSDLVTELLPEIARVRPPAWRRGNLPSALVDMLNQDAESPFFGIIRRASTPADDKKVDRRHRHQPGRGAPGVARVAVRGPVPLSQHRERDDRHRRHPTCAHHLLGRRARHLPGGLGREPRPRVRLMGGVGIRAMGRLMERVMAHVETTTPRLVSAPQQNSRLIAPQVPLDGGHVGRPRPCVERTAEHPSAHQRPVELPGADVPR